MIKITCSILCYNYGRFLTQAIESCLNQQHGDYEIEIIVIDDGSTDETPEICQTFHERIRIIRSFNLGFGASLDRAIREAKGDYVCLLDADDYYSTDMIKEVLPLMQDGYLYIEHQKFIVDEIGKPVNDLVHKGGSTSTLCLQRIAALTLLPVQNEIFFHPLEAAGFGIELKKPLSYYRVHQKSMINDNPPGKWYLHHAEVVHRLVDKLLTNANCYPWASADRIQRICKGYRSIAFQSEMEAALQLGQKRAALNACLRTLWYAGQSPNGLENRHLRLLARCLLGRAMRPLIQKQS